MAFRANEAADYGRERAFRKLVPRDLDPAEQAKAREFVDDLIDKLGPVVDGYPTWHPLVANHSPREVEFTPSDRCGYRGLDHTICFRGGFVTCPYPDGDATVLESVSELRRDEIGTVQAELLDVTLYHPTAVPIIVKCEWSKPMLADGTIPAAIAVPMILEREVPCWRWSERGETWETMRPYLIGQPCGSRSSLFINQETASTIRKIWRILIETGAFGPLKVGQR